MNEGCKRYVEVLENEIINKLKNNQIKQSTRVLVRFKNVFPFSCFRMCRNAHPIGIGEIEKRGSFNLDTMYSITRATIERVYGIKAKVSNETVRVM